MGAEKCSRPSMRKITSVVISSRSLRMCEVSRMSFPFRSFGAGLFP